MTFKIAVFVKQVPDTTDIKWTKDNTIQREGLDSVINPYDIGAIYLAKCAKEELTKQGINVEIYVVTMGPQQAEDVLNLALAFGCDKAVLLSDKKYSGSDTLATAYTLYSYIKNRLSDVNIILCGQQAIDGDTAQTPSSLAQKLGFAQITNVTKLNEINSDYSIWTKETSKHIQEIRTDYPLLIATVLCNVNISCVIDDYIRAQNSVIEVLTADDICADNSKIGFKGSPTIVKKAYRHEFERNTQYIKDYSSDKIAEFILNEIDNCRLKEL